MTRLASRLRRDADFEENARHHRTLAAELRERLARVREGGPPEARRRHVERGRLLVRERIERLLDPGTPFVELMPFVAEGCYDGATPAGGLVTGIGTVSGHQAMVIANDVTVKGGTLYPLTVQKQLRAQQIALENRLPCVYLVDSGGAFLPLQAEIFTPGGRIFFNEAVMSAEGIPQVAVVHGPSTAGGAYVPAMCDENIIVRGQGAIYLGGPPLVRAATGEQVTAEELGGGEVHTRISGVSDHLASDDAHGLALARQALAQVPPVRPAVEPRTVDPPAEDPADLYGILPRDPRRQYDVREVIARLVDGSRFHEFKPLYGTTLVTGFARLHGYEVGVLANNGVLFSEAALKGTHFILLACQRRVPLVFLQNITGFMVGKQYEHGGITKDGAKMVHAVATAQVPKLTVMVGASHGAGNYAMCGRSYGPRFLFSWPNARISVMGGEQAAMTLLSVKREQLRAQGKTLTPEEEATLTAPILAKYEEESSALYASARLWDDGIIDPVDTRDVLGLALAVVLRSPVPPPKHGVLRM
ncbi:MAG TPA: carboxyl transferase domain-containing protein [Candidatus Binatus sp.]|nr:carboxyl transferase domain-containing protein [Candidatus Binatus sp.]